MTPESRQNHPLPNSTSQTEEFGLGLTNTGTIILPAEQVANAKSHEFPEATTKSRRQSPETLRRRAQAIRAAWDTEEKKAAMTAKIHTPESDEKRRQTTAKNWRAGAYKNQRDRISQTRKKLRLKRLERLLGENPLLMVSELFQLPNSKIAAKLGTTSNFVSSVRKNLRIEKPNRRPRAIQEREKLVQKAKGLNLLKSLTPEQRAVLTLRYLQDDHPLTLAEIGEKFGITKEAVRQRESAGLKKTH